MRGGVRASSLHLAQGRAGGGAVRGNVGGHLLPLLRPELAAAELGPPLLVGIEEVHGLHVRPWLPCSPD
ncbi:hypothetical protein E2562_016070 [Oryza meyeriana var. granulata]|uniref:Uncharacterized protein n=1 Tax=Oryza meyeriana var. granulata TaxID=110450 RepID=A0A6G1BMG8_9ORYZ|nr:hypothetical protein E2562_016070 [Oryza meyeriana var. granulata]